MSKILNIDKAAERIRQAVKNNERIFLYGDSDLDGISSVVILEEAIKSLPASPSQGGGGHVEDAFFPDRENDGYGINMRALEMLKDKGPALFITLDLGIGNVKEVEAANAMGFDVIIVDHHEPLHQIPPASIIVDMKQAHDPYPFKGLANVGITFRLCEEILGKDISVNLRRGFAELAALGTIADMVPQVDENVDIIEEGLRSLRSSFRPAFKAFFEVFGEGQIFENNIPKMISALNAAESVNFKNDSYKLLTSSSMEDCRELVDKLLSKNLRKQQTIRDISEEIDRRFSKKLDDAVIFEGDPSWRLTLAGTVASIACSKYNKPAFIFKKMDKESCGSVRNPKGTSSVEAMKTCSDILITYGGHACASGFRIENKHLDEFKRRLEKYFSN